MASERVYRDDPFPLATMAADLLSRAAAKPGQPDADLAAILEELAKVVPVLRYDEPHLMRSETMARLGIR
jgi:hypothetical protein